MTSPYTASANGIAETVLVPKEHLSGGSVGAKIAIGMDSSIAVATRQPGYHSKPHRHDAEQLNYVLQGEIYIFVEDTGFLASAGDFFRVPKNATHWSWVRGKGECVLISSYSPSLIDPGFEETAASLLNDEERIRTRHSVASVYPENFDHEAVERAVLAKPASAK